MTRILQFRCTDPDAAANLRQEMVRRFNIWSRLSLHQATNPTYRTRELTTKIWRTKVSDPHTSWLYYDQLHSVLGVDGAFMADDLIGSIDVAGFLRRVSIHQPEPPTVMLDLVEIADLYGGDYLLADGDTGQTSDPEPMPDDDPPPFEPNPDDNPDLSLRDTTPPPEIPSVGWIFVVATTAQIAAMAQAATSAGLDDGQDQIHRAGSSPSGTPRWALKKHKLSPALLAIYGDPYWQVNAPAIWGANAQWPAGAQQ